MKCLGRCGGAAQQLVCRKEDEIYYPRCFPCPLCHFFLSFFPFFSTFPSFFPPFFFLFFSYPLLSPHYYKAPAPPRDAALLKRKKKKK